MAPEPVLVAERHRTASRTERQHEKACEVLRHGGVSKLLGEHVEGLPRSCHRHVGRAEFSVLLLGADFLAGLTHDRVGCRVILGGKKASPGRRIPSAQMKGVGVVASLPVESRHDTHVEGEPLALVHRHHADHTGGLRLLDDMALQEGNELGNRSPVGGVVLGGSREKIRGPSRKEGVEGNTLCPRSDRGLVSPSCDQRERGGSERLHAFHEKHTQRRGAEEREREGILREPGHPECRQERDAQGIVVARIALSLHGDRDAACLEKRGDQ